MKNIARNKMVRNLVRLAKSMLVADAKKDMMLPDRNVDREDIRTFLRSPEARALTRKFVVSLYALAKPKNLLFAMELSRFHRILMARIATEVKILAKKNAKA